MAYTKLKDTIFTGATGRELRRHPPEVRELQFWLTCGPDSDPFGIFICELATIAPRIGRTVASLQKSLETLVALEFCLRDEASQYVWVREMAHHQFDTPCKATDFRCASARKWYASAPRNPFLGPWFDRYVEDFHLQKDPHAVERRDYAPSPGASPGASDAPMVGLFGDLPGSSEIKPPTGQLVAGPDTPLKGADLEAAFNRLWSVYPNAVEKKEARQMFVKAKPTPALVAIMLAAVDAQRTGRQWSQGYIPKLANWLEKQRWLDKVVPAHQTGPAMTQKTSNTMGAAARFVERRQTPRHPS